MSSPTTPNTEIFRHLRFDSDSSATEFTRVHTHTAPRHAVRSEREEPELDADMARLFDWLCKRAGVRSHDYRRAVFHRRGGACLRTVRCPSFREALARAISHPAQADRLLDAMMVGVTSFFRDATVFQGLGALLAQRMAKPPDDRPAWSIRSVGCSNGAELYSCAILLDRLGLLNHARLAGIDCRPGAITAARAGQYPTEAVAALDANAMQAYFVRTRSLVRVRQHLADACAWSVADALTDGTPEAEDVILCRNLAIYLTPDSAARLWTHLAWQLRPSGLLVVGKAEQPPAECFWKLAPCLYERKACLR